LPELLGLKKLAGSSALELAAALRVASGLGDSTAAVPALDDAVRDAWLADAPQPLAESVAALDGAHNAHQARDAAQELVRTLLRYLLALALATRSPGGDDQDDPALLELVRALSKRALAAEERLQLLRLLVRPHGDHPVPEHGDHPVPELVDLVLPGPDGTDALEPILGLYSLTDHAGSEDAVRVRLSWLIPELTQLLRKTTFLLDYLLVVPRDHAAERWTGQRQQHRGGGDARLRRGGAQPDERDPEEAERAEGDRRQRAGQGTVREDLDEPAHQRLDPAARDGRLGQLSGRR